ncbi:MAG TPA: divalent-cation tolerance protein CutA [Rhodocyclaceae bacterium]|jgi:periplasmic divalent cation tolerance protein|nr:divalent-cation tolerance protein CutA [Rhodocyclaceae bacterium]
MDETLLLMTNLPDAASAEALALRLVEARLAACVNQLAPCSSVYRWQDGISTATEIPLLIKTMRSRYNDIEALVRELHPYDVPELIAMPIVAGLPDYLNWVRQESAPKISC